MKQSRPKPPSQWQCPYHLQDRLLGWSKVRSPEKDFTPHLRPRKSKKCVPALKRDLQICDSAPIRPAPGAEPVMMVITISFWSTKRTAWRKVRKWAWFEKCSVAISGRNEYCQTWKPPVVAGSFHQTMCDFLRELFFTYPASLTIAKVAPPLALPWNNFNEVLFSTMKMVYYSQHQINDMSRKENECIGFSQYS